MNSTKSIYELKPQILQVEKVTNVTLSKQKKMAIIQSVNRLLKLELTDGETKMTAVESKVINELDESTPLGTSALDKIKFSIIRHQIVSNKGFSTMKMC